MRKLLLSLSAIFALSAAAVPAAHADVYTYTFTGGFNGSFSLDSSAAEYGFRAERFLYAPVSNASGDLAGLTYVAFFNAAYVLPIDLETFEPTDWVTSGAQLYSGSESSPTYLTGAFHLTNFRNGNPITLNVVDTTTAITPVATTPEPSSLVLLGTGILGTVGSMRRRFCTA